MTIVGARPQFVKAAMLSRALRAAGLHEDLVHTGQHYDDAMSGAFFRQLGLPEPAINLHVGSASHGAQTGRMLEGLERAMLDLCPDTVVIFGDTNSTLAGALAAAKLKIPIAHVEAGMRSGDRGMPEEINRIVTDHLCDQLYAPDQISSEQLLSEGISPKRIHITGDIMHEATLCHVPVDPLLTLNAYQVKLKSFIYATVHRSENTDDQGRLREILEGLDTIAKDLPVVFCAHPRTAAKLAELSWKAKHLSMHGPADYASSLALCASSRLVVTDSGGLQREAAWLGTPSVILRSSTEWPTLVSSGASRLAPPGTLLEQVINVLRDDVNKPTIKPEKITPTASIIVDLLRRVVL